MTVKPLNDVVPELGVLSFEQQTNESQNLCLEDHPHRALAKLR